MNTRGDGGGWGVAVTINLREGRGWGGSQCVSCPIHYPGAEMCAHTRARASATCVRARAALGRPQWLPGITPRWAAGTGCCQQPAGHSRSALLRTLPSPHNTPPTPPALLLPPLLSSSYLLLTLFFSLFSSIYCFPARDASVFLSHCLAQTVNQSCS